MTTYLFRLLARRTNAAAAACALAVAAFGLAALLTGNLLFLSGAVMFTFGWFASDDDDE